MNVLVAPNAFKGNLDARQVAEALAKGLERANSNLNVIQLPIADGGEGTVDILLQATGGQRVEAKNRQCYRYAYQGTLRYLARWQYRCA